MQWPTVGLDRIMSGDTQIQYYAAFFAFAGGTDHTELKKGSLVGSANDIPH
jgi:hypothetical protein